MKNYLYKSVLVIFLMLLTACGTNSKKNPPKPEGVYSFFNATTPLAIREATSRNIIDENNNTISVTEGNTYTIKVQLLEFGLLKPGEAIQMKPFDFKFGFVTNTVVPTNANGEGEFEYNVPEKYSEVRGKSVTLQAVYLDNKPIVPNSNGKPTQREIVLTQDFVLNFK